MNPRLKICNNFPIRLKRLQILGLYVIIFNKKQFKVCDCIFARDIPNTDHGGILELPPWFDRLVIYWTYFLWGCGLGIGAYTIRGK